MKAVHTHCSTFERLHFTHPWLCVASLYKPHHLTLRPPPQGHAGITAPSPQDVKDMGGEGRLVAVFGRDASGSGASHHGTQQRWVFVTATPEEKVEFTRAIERSVTTKVE